MSNNEDTKIFDDLIDIHNFVFRPKSEADDKSLEVIMKNENPKVPARNYDIYTGRFEYADGLIEGIYVSPAIRPNLNNHLLQECDEVLIKLNSINDIDPSPVDWSVCDEKLGLRFSVVPYYLITIKDGIIPPKYITK